MLILEILAFIFLIVGVLIVFLARWLVNKYELDKNTKAENEEEMDEEELLQYKKNKAVLNIKMLGMLILLPGIVLLLVLFR